MSSFCWWHLSISDYQYYQFLIEHVLIELVDNIFTIFFIFFILINLVFDYSLKLYKEIFY